MAVNPIPKGYNTVSPYLMVPDAPSFMVFTQRAFGGVERSRHLGPDGKVVHGEVLIGESVIMVADACAGIPPNPTGLHLYVTDTDTTYRQALIAGATSLREPADQFYGDRSASIKDPAGNTWWIATHVQDVAEDVIDQHNAKI